MDKFQNFTFETSETFGVTSVEIQFIPFFYSGKEKRDLDIIMFYLEMS